MSTQKHPNKKCEFCKAEFTPRNEKQRFCKGNHPMTCAICKKDFIGKVHRGRFEYSCGEKRCKELLKKQTNLKKYGVIHPSKLKEVQEKAKQTNLKKYGVESPAQSKEIQDKMKKTTLERYGVENAFQSKELQEKTKQTNLKKYGYEYAAQSKEIKNTIRKTSLERYGATSSLGNKEVREKAKRTMIERYGAEHPLQSQEVMSRMKKTQLDRGLAHSSDEEIVNTIKNWQENNGRKPTLTELANHWGYANLSCVGKRISKLELDNFINKKDSCFELRMKEFLDKSELSYIRNDRKQIKPLELDFWLPDHNVAIEINDFLTHNSTYCPWGVEPKPKYYHIDKTKLCRDKGIRLIHAWEDQILDDAKFKVLKNAILHACGKSTHKVYARNTRIEVRPAIEMKNFFNENNIAGYRGAKEVYVLVCKKTNEDLMAYSVGHARFGKGKYDAEIIRGACKLGYIVVGGASKLWKYIINNTEYNSIVYYVDLNTYAGESMNFLENVEFVSEQPGLKNYWVKEKRLKNREPARHKEIVELTKQGKVWTIWDAGVQVNVWHRK